MAEKQAGQGFFSISIELEGPETSKLNNESGGHRIQRIPPTEKSGRVHTSTVTVSVLDEFTTSLASIPESEIHIEWFSGSGAGGQHRNKHQNSCRITHIPTGIVCTAQTRNRVSSKQQALNELVKRVNNQKVGNVMAERSKEKHKQVGSGQRGDKIRTIRLQDNRAIDHRNNRKCSAEEYLNGGMHKLW